MAKKPQPYYQFGQRLTEGIKRSAKNESVVYTQERLAHELGVSFNTVYTWRRGEHLPEPELVAKIAHYFVENWGPDTTWMADFLQKGEYGSLETINGLMVDLYGQPGVSTADLNPDFNPRNLQGLPLDIFNFLASGEPGSLKTLHTYKQLLIQNHWTFPDPLDLCRQLLTTGVKYLQQRHPHLAQYLIQTYFKELNEWLAETQLPKAPHQKVELHLALEQLAHIVSMLEEKACTSYKLNLQFRIHHQPTAILFGVETALDKLRGAISKPDNHWLVAIDGLGGLGKTTLATTILFEFICSDYFYGVAWVSAKQEHFLPTFELRQNQPSVLGEEGLIEAILEQLLGDNPIPTSPGERKLMLTQLCKTYPFLIVIDNLETVADYRTILPILDHLAKPTKFLLTTRHNLGHYTQAFSLNLNELNEEDTLKFLHHEAKMRNISAIYQATASQLKAIYQTVGGNPLVLKLVVGQTTSIPIDQVLANLRRTQGPKADELYTYIYKQAWEMLDEASRCVLLAMPLLQGGTLAHLETITHLDQATLTIALDKLVFLSLVEVNQKVQDYRYHLHRLTEAFLLNEVQLAKIPLNNHQTCADYFKTCVINNVHYWLDEVVANKGDIAYLAREEDRLIKAISLGLGDKTMWEMVYALSNTVSIYIARRGERHIWKTVLQQVLVVAGEVGDTTADVALSLRLAGLSQRTEPFKKVKLLYWQTMKQARQIDDEISKARAMSNLGFLCDEQGYEYRAEVLCCHALTIFEKRNHLHGRAHTENHLGILYTHQERWTEAEKRFKQAKQIWEEMGDNHGIVYSLTNFSFLYMKMANFPKTIAYCEQTLNILQLVGDDFFKAQIYLILANVYRLQGQLLKAKQIAQQAEFLFGQLADLLGLARARGNLGLTYLEQDELDLALGCFKKAYDMFQKLDNLQGQINTLVDLINIHINLKDYSKANDYLQILDTSFQKVYQQKRYRALQERLAQYRQQLGS